MKYIYKNITPNHQMVLLASKNQDTVGTRTFNPGATLELDYPGLSLYVPNILSCLVIGNEHSVISPTEPVVVVPPEPVVVPEPIVISKPVVVPEPVVVPKTKPAIAAKAKAIKKIKK